MIRRVFVLVFALTMFVSLSGCKLLKRTAPVSITVSKTTYSAGEPILVMFSRPLTPPSGQQHWITIVPMTARESEWGTYEYVAFGATSAVLKTSTPGAYEIRLHDQYPKYPYKVLARTFVTVDSSLATPTLPVVGGVTVSTSKISYGVGETINVSFGRALVTPSGQQHWLTLCPAGARDTEWGTWHYVKPGATSDTLTAMKPGVYEVRLHDLYPLHPYGVIGRQTITVR